MTINITIPKITIEAQLKPRITVIGVGGAGGNAVNNMIQSAMDGVDFVVANTDAQALSNSRTDRRIQLGRDTTQGLGAGARPDIGRDSAEEAIELIARELEGAHMAFITAGMGGGTGTGAAPVVARAAKEMGVLTVGVVTKPFQFEGIHRMRLAEAGIEALAAFVDTLIVIPNQNLFRVANEKTTFADAFKMADDVLYAGVRSVTDLMMMPGLINLDFADVRTVMQEMGRAMMGTGEASGADRAINAAELAIANPLLEDTSMRGARGVLINITGGSDITLFEVDEAANRVREEVETDAHIIFGSCFDESMAGKIRVSVVATGIESEAGVQPRPVSSRVETRAVARALPEAPAQRAPVRNTRPAAAAQAAAPTFSFGATLAPAGGTTELMAEEKALVEMAAAVKMDAVAASQENDAAYAAAPAPVMAQPAAPMPQPIMAQPMIAQPMMAQPAPSLTAQPTAPIAAQAAAVAEAMTRATPIAARPMIVPPTVAMQVGAMQAGAGQIGAGRDVFIPRAPVMPPRPEVRSQGLPLPEPLAAAPAPVEPAPKVSKPSLFSRYMSNRAKTEPAAEPAQAAPAAPRADRPVPIAVSPMDRTSVSSHNEDELEIPAFLRRQAN